MSADERDPQQNSNNSPAGGKDWKPTPIDWSATFPRSPQHLSNQLRTGIRGRNSYSAGGSYPVLCMIVL
jgi:hypothetical protein